MLGNLISGFLTVFSYPINLLVVFLGVGLGAIIGAMPGLTATMGIAVALPITFGLPAEVGLTLLISIFIGGIYGGGIPAILIKTPGTPASAATIADGFSLTKKGEASKALGIHVFSSSFATLVGTFILIFASSIIASFALEFGAAEYFLLSVFGLSIIASVTGDSLVKGLIAGVIGIILSTVGMDPIVGFPRFTFGNYEMMQGFSLVPALIGLFAISQVFNEIEDIEMSIVKTGKVKGGFPKISEIKSIIPISIQSAFIGTFIGAIPGPGAILGSFIPYSYAKKQSKNPEKFGQGEIKGIAAAEAGNNSAVLGALIPTLTLGIPGEAATAVLLGGLMILGLKPGPMLFVDNINTVYTVFASIIIAAFVLLAEGLFLSKYMGKLITISKKILLPSILILCVIGSFAIRNSVFDIGVALAFGILGYIFVKLNFPIVPILLGLILGPIAESNLRRALMISKGNLNIFFQSWLSIVLIVLTVISLIIGVKMSNKLTEIKTNNQGDEYNVQ